MNKKKKPEHFVIDEFPTIHLYNIKDEFILPSPGNGKSIIGDSLEKLVKKGWNALDEKEQIVLKDLKVAFPMYKQVIEDAIKKSSTEGNEI